jgi:hypothetical protein
MLNRYVNYININHLEKASSRFDKKGEWTFLRLLFKNWILCLMSGPEKINLRLTSLLPQSLNSRIINIADTRLDKAVLIKFH